MRPFKKRSNAIFFCCLIILGYLETVWQTYLQLTVRATSPQIKPDMILCLYKSSGLLLYLVSLYLTTQLAHQMVKVIMCAAHVVHFMYYSSLCRLTAGLWLKVKCLAVAQGAFTPKLPHLLLTHTALRQLF